jgi:hypothetical protein
VPCNSSALAEANCISELTISIALIGGDCNRIRTLGGEIRTWKMTDGAERTELLEKMTFY